MPTYDPTIQGKLDALQALTGADRRPAELVCIYWPSPAGTKVYASAMYTELPWWPDLADAIETYFGDPIPITLTLIPDGTPFIDLPHAASISDDSINLTFDDTDGEFSTLLMTYGEGLRVEVFGYWPAVDLLLSMWRGMLHQPREMNRDQVKINATSGWRAPQMLVPKRPHATSCPFIFGAHLSSQEEIDFHKGCPFNRHVGGTIGNPAYIDGDCPRRVKADCVERLTEDDGVTPTERYWPGFETRPDPIPNNQTKGPNLLARAIGNESNLNDPVRAIFGERYVKALNLLAFRNETNNNHPEDGFFAGLFEVGEGALLALWEFRMMGQLVGAEHFQLRLGALGQQPTDWSPDVNSYSGTAHGYGRIQGEPDNATASDYSASIRALGLRDIRVYSDADSYAEGYTTNRVWCLLELLANARWGYGLDYPRFDIQSWIDAAAWCDEHVTLTDANGNTFSGVRSTFNAEVTARAIQQQVKDICTAGRLGIPFEFEGKEVIVPLKAEDVDDPTIALFTDEGPNRNIVYDGAKSSLTWSHISDETMTNQWTVNFDEAANGGVDTQFIFGDQPQQLRAGRAWGDRSKRVINKSQAGYGINSAQEAARFGNSLLYLGPLDSGGILNPFSVKFTTWYSEAFNVQNYKLIKVVNTKLQSRMTTYFTTRGLSPYPGADYTCFRVTKYTRKGDLRVEIEAQQYATLDIVVSEPTCVPDAAFLIEYDLDDSDNVEIQSDGSVLRDGGVAGTNDAVARSAYIVAGSNCARWEWTISEVEESDLVFYLLEDEQQENYFGWAFTNEGVNFRRSPYHNGGELALSFRNNELGYNRFALELEDDAVKLFETPDSGTDDTFIEPRSYQYSLPAGRNWRLIVLVENLLSRAAAVIETNGIGLTGFGPPRDFTAEVNASTGQVQFAWAPPLLHPELVTGYQMWDADGNLIMATDLVYAFETTLSPGTYTYKVRATDGTRWSGYAIVVFTVPEPPITGTDLFVIDDLTLTNVLDDLTLNQVTA